LTSAATRAESGKKSMRENNNGYEEGISKDACNWGKKTAKRFRELAFGLPAESLD